jgi:hypothetical protein
LASEHKIDVTRWERILRRNDVAMASATILADPECRRIAGIDVLREAVERTKSDGVLSLDEEHLAGATGSLATYAGVLASLGLVRVASGIFRNTQSGDRLADAFEANLRATGVRVGDKLTLAELARLGEACALSRFAESSLRSPSILAERDAVRDAVLHGTAVARPLRKPTIGLLLHAHRLFNSMPRASDFRALLVLGSIRRGALQEKWSLPPRYTAVRAVWNAYAAHSYGTYALESLLAFVLAVAVSESGGRDDGVPLQALLDRGSSAAVGEKDCQLTETVAGLESAIQSELHESLESGLVGQLRKSHRRGDPHPEWAKAAFHLFLLAVVRLKKAIAAHGDGVWLGDRSWWRWPPARLIAHVDDARATNLTATAYARRVLSELVVEQHRSNALRKLASDPSKYTVRFEIEGDRLVPLADHEAGTSSPRFENAVTVLKDLGWLTEGTVTTPTVDGDALLGGIDTEAL